MDFLNHNAGVNGPCAGGPVFLVFCFLKEKVVVGGHVPSNLRTQDLRNDLRKLK